MTSELTHAYTLSRWDYLSKAPCALGDKHFFILEIRRFRSLLHEHLPLYTQGIQGLPTKSDTKHGPRDNSYF